MSNPRGFRPSGLACGRAVVLARPLQEVKRFVQLRLSSSLSLRSARFRVQSLRFRITSRVWSSEFIIEG